MTPPDHDDDPLANLRARIRETQAAAEQLADETAAARAQADPPPGWATPEDHERRGAEVHALVSLLESLRDLIPDDLREQFRELLRQVLLLVRALIDWWVERMEPRGTMDESRGPVVEDIPVA
jgi:hypothetical protein